jgi:hypothetical protein
MRWLTMLLLAGCAWESKKPYANDPLLTQRKPKVGKVEAKPEVAKREPTAPVGPQVRASAQK